MWTKMINYTFVALFVCSLPAFCTYNNLQINDQARFFLLYNIRCVYVIELIRMTNLEEEKWKC